MRTLRVLLLSAVIASPALAGGETGAAGAPAEGASREVAQRQAKHALGATRLPDEIMTALQARLEAASSRWAQHVMKVGAHVARTEDLELTVVEPFRRALEAEGVALSEQELLLDAIARRAEATVVDFEAMSAAQARMKQACADSGLEEAALSDLFQAAREWAEDARGSVAVLGAGVDRFPASDLVKAEFLPRIEAADVPEMHRDDMVRALVDWIEAYGRLAVEADPDR